MENRSVLRGLRPVARRKLACRTLARKAYARDKHLLESEGEGASKCPRFILRRSLENS
jgi:hypothetical protein